MRKLISGTAATLLGCMLTAGAEARPLFPGQSYATGAGPTTLALADLDGDALLDLVTADGAAQAIGVRLGNADGSFRPAASFALGDRPWPSPSWTEIRSPTLSSPG